MLAPVACVLPQSVGDDPGGSSSSSANTENTTSAASSGSPGDTSTGTGGDGTTSDSDSSGTSTDASSGEDTGTDTGETAASVCDPQPELIGANVEWLDEDPEPLGGTTDVDADCEVLAISPAELDTQLDLDCEGDPMSFAIFTDPPVTLPLSVGEVLHTRMREITTIDRGTYLYLSLADASGLRLGYIAQPFPGQQPIDLDQWLIPLAIELDEDVCDPEPFDPPEPGRMFVIDPCPAQEERLAIDVLGAGQPPVQVLDQTRSSAHGYDVWVHRAVHLTYPENPECGTGRTLFRVMMLAEP